MNVLNDWKGRVISPTLPVIVAFGRYKAHFRADELTRPVEPFQEDPFLTIHIPQPQLDRLAASGRHHAAAEIGLNRQLTMAPIHHRQEHHPLGPPPALQGLERRTHGPACEDHVIHQHHLPFFHTVGKRG